MSATSHRRSATNLTARLRCVAAGLAALIAVFYGLIWAGVLSVVTEAESGELGILGFAGLVFLGLAVLLWRWRHRVVWVGAALLQVLVIWMYVVVGAERDPAFEVWGISIRVAQVTLLGVLVTLVVWDKRERRSAG